MTAKRIDKKGWIEYLFLGGGIFKPFLRIERMIFQLAIKKSPPNKFLMIFMLKEMSSRACSQEEILKDGADSQAQVA